MIIYDLNLNYCSRLSIVSLSRLLLLLRFRMAARPFLLPTQDMPIRTNKKVKGGEQGFTGESSVLVVYDDMIQEPMGEAAIAPQRSYKASLLGNETTISVDGARQAVQEEHVMNDVGVDDGSGTQPGTGGKIVEITIIEGKLGHIDCLPLFFQIKRRIVFVLPVRTELS